MENERPEFFKLDETDRKVLFWLMDHVPVQSIKSWMEYVAGEYKEKGIFIDHIKLFEETQQGEEL